MFRITNGNEQDFIGRYNGRDYLFPAGSPAYCDDDASAHIFGIGNPDKSTVLARHGWACVTSNIAAGMRILNAFTFEHMSPAYDAPLALIEDHGPAPVGQDAAGAGEGTDGSAAAPAAVAVSGGQGSLNNPSGRLPPA